jgi:hypothetical protein
MVKSGTKTHIERTSEVVVKRLRGRPPLPAGEKMEELRVAVHPRQRAMLERIATDTGASMSVIVREAVDEWAKARGLI